MTLDVAALYPSIRTAEALKALKKAFSEDTTTNSNIKEALLSFSELIFDKSYVKYKNKCYKPLVGITTDGCNSRQTADCLLHYLLELVKGDIPRWNLLSLLKRFIDDIFALWYGTKRQFDSLVSQLNKLLEPYGIRFGDWALGITVHFLDVILFIDEDGFIQYRLFKKPTDSRLYLRTSSFHPKHVFDSVAFSQIRRVKNRNSTAQYADEDIKDLITDLLKCGYKQDKLDKLVEKVVRNGGSDKIKTKSSATLTLIVPYFAELNQLKDFLRTIEKDIKILTGNDTRVLVAARRGRSIGSVVVKNNQLCAEYKPNLDNSQKCGAKGCLTCPSIYDGNEGFNVNGKLLKPEKQLNCKSDNEIYLAQCILCNPIMDKGISIAMVVRHLTRYIQE